MNIADVMKHRVITVRPDSSLADAGRLMLDNAVSGLAVVDGGGELVGILSEGDFLRRAEIGTERKRPRWLEFFVGAGALSEDYVRSHASKVEDVMTRDVAAVSEEASLREAVDLMTKRGVKRLPVLRGRTLVGIVSRSDLLRAVTGLMTDKSGAATSDATIRETLLAELSRLPWAPVASVEVFVRDGVIRLRGTISDERQRTALAVAARNTPGARDVVDQLVSVEAMSGYIVEPADDAPDEGTPSDPGQGGKDGGGAAEAAGHEPAAPRAGEPPAEAGLLRPDALRRIASEQRMEKRRQAEEQTRKQREELKELHEAFLHRHMQPGSEERFNHRLRQAAENGEHEILALRFPSDWCNDGGRAVNNLSEDWPASLSGYAKELYEAYDARLRPSGYRIRAQVLNYPDGMPGDIGIFLEW